MFFIGFAAMPFKKFYNSLTQLVFTDDPIDEDLKKPSAQENSEKVAAGFIISEQIIQSQVFNQRQYTGYAFSGEQGNAKSLTTVV